MKNILLATALLVISMYGQSQTKVFKEVNQDVSSEIKAIVQDGSLVGYVLFTELEKASDKTFNYRITIMDENLNDIGTIKFEDEKLLLQQVAFEGDVLCLAYIKSNFIGKAFDKVRDFRKQKAAGVKDSIFTQFVSLDGKIINAHSIKADITSDGEYDHVKKKVKGEGELKHQVQLKNIAGTGFAMFYGDENKNQLVTYDLRGAQIIKKRIKDKGDDFALLTSGTDVYILVRTDSHDKTFGSEYSMLAYRPSDSTTLPKYKLTDKRGNALKVIAFDNDPVTGKPFVSGNIIERNALKYDNVKEMKRGAYVGVFTINFKSTRKADVTESYSYWNDGSAPMFMGNGLISEKDAFARQTLSFRDYSGNTYFVGSSVIKKTRWGAIAGAVITSPLLVGPVLFLAGGTQKSKTSDVVVMKQTKKGDLTVENSFKSDAGKYFQAKTPVDVYDVRSYYTVTNPDEKISYLICYDYDNITIYNVNEKKVMRTIPRWKGSLETSVFPAKEGHILVAQYDKKQKSRRFSIEAL